MNAGTEHSGFPPSTLASRWKYPFCFVSTVAAALVAQFLSHIMIPNSPWSWRVIYGNVFQASLLIGLFPFCERPQRLLAFLFLLDWEWLICDALKIRFLHTPLFPADMVLLPELFSLLQALGPWRRAGFYLLLVIVPLTLVGGTVACFRCRRRPRAAEAIWLVPLFLLTIAIIGFPRSYRRNLARLIGDEPVLMRMRGEIYGRVLNFSMELARNIEEYRYRPGREEVAAARNWFDAHTQREELPVNRPMTARNVYVILVESFWDPGRLLESVPGVPFLAPEFAEAWNTNGSALLFTPVYGSGTANTEFEILCGVPAAVVGGGIAFLEGLSNRLPCLPQILHDKGYRTFAFHANLPGYYHRSSQFPAIGFDRFFSVNDFKNDISAGPYLVDPSFLRQSIEMAKKNSGGKPFLAYMMTLAGHWPYPWSDLYPRAFSLIKGGTRDFDDEAVRQLDINLYTSKVIAQMLQELSREDPGAIIVVAGDHLPSTSFSLSTLSPARWSFLGDPVWFETPLLFIDEGRPIRGTIAAFELGSRILDALGISGASRGAFQYFGRVDQGLVRPVVPGKIFLLKSHGFDLCSTDTRRPECSELVTWWNYAHALGTDLARGYQFALSPLSH